jgi:zinc transport system substrate-binding protein
MAIPTGGMNKGGTLGSRTAWAAVAWLLLLSALAGPAVAKAPVVVVTVRPLTALVAAVMQGIGKPTTLIPTDQRPETFELHNQDEDTLRQADLVFWVGPSLEASLVQPFADLEIGARIAELDDTPGLLVFQRRRGGEWDVPAIAGQAPAPATAHGDADGHIWLDADNVKLLIGRIAEALIDVDFADAEVYRSNAETLRKKVDALDRELADGLSSFHDRPFLQMHDDFQYFEARYNLSGAGAVGLEVDALPSSQLKALVARVARLHAVCVVGDEPGDSVDLQAISTAAGVRTALIDPYGAAYSETPDLYFQTMRGIAAQFAHCLSGP